MSETNSKMRPGIIRSIQRPGGKTRLLPVLLPLFAECPHTCYVEPFAGSFTAGINKPRSKVEVLNDLDQELINAFRQIKLHPDSLLKELDWVLNSRWNLKHLQRGNADHHTEIQRAALYLHAVMISFGADGRGFGVQRSSRGGAGSKMDGLREKIQVLSERLQSVIVESVPWYHCLKLYDSPGTLFFCDPPYTTGIVKAYQEFTEADMDALLTGLLALKGQWVLTVDDTPANRKRFGRWLAAEKESASLNSNAHGRSGGTFKELVCASWKAKKSLEAKVRAGRE